MISLCNTFKVCRVDSNTPGFIPDFNNYCHFFGGLFCVLFVVLFGLSSESHSYSVFTYFFKYLEFCFIYLLSSCYSIYCLTCSLCSLGWTCTWPSVSYGRGVGPWFKAFALFWRRGLQFHIPSRNCFSSPHACCSVQFMFSLINSAVTSSTHGFLRYVFKGPNTGWFSRLFSLTCAYLTPL